MSITKTCSYSPEHMTGLRENSSNSSHLASVFTIPAQSVCLHLFDLVCLANSYSCIRAQLKYLLFQDEFISLTATQAEGRTSPQGSFSTLFMLLSSQLHQLLPVLIGKWELPQDLPHGLAGRAIWLNTSRALLRIIGTHEVLSKSWAWLLKQGFKVL